MSYLSPGLSMLLLATTFTYSMVSSQDYQAIVDEIAEYEDDILNIMDYMTKGDGRGQAYDKCADITDRFGGRHTCSKALDDAQDYLMSVLIDAGFDNVHGENVTTPMWLRGEETAEMLEPMVKKIHIMSLFDSNSTVPEGITADVIVVKTFDELDLLDSEQVEGKIVVYNQEYVGYGGTVQYRSDGARRAADLGAVASLTRSITDFSIYSTHTGAQEYDPTDSDKWIPTACITVEDAELMQRYQDKGITPRLHIYMNHTRNLDGCTTRNIVADITGSEKPEELVVIGGHFDSWDVGTGAMDDMGGVAISWQTLAALKDLGYHAKRTIRLVAWTAEEIGVYGGDKYYEDNKEDAPFTSLMMESDSGTFTPYGLGFTGSGLAKATLEEIISYLEEIGTTTVVDGGSQADTGQWLADDVPLATLYQDGSKYFYFHHSHGDTMTVQDTDILDDCTALWAAVTYVVADMSEMLPREGAYPTSESTAEAVFIQPNLCVFLFSVLVAMYRVF